MYLSVCIAEAIFVHCIFSTQQTDKLFLDESRTTIRAFPTMSDATSSDDKEKEGTVGRNARHVEKRSPRQQRQWNRRRPNQKQLQSLMPRQKREASKKKLASLPVPQHTIGAGNELGLSVMVDNQIEKYFLTSGSFVGSKVCRRRHRKCDMASSSSHARLF